MKGRRNFQAIRAMHKKGEIENEIEMHREKISDNPASLCLSLSLSDIGMKVSVFANGAGDLGSIPGRIIPKTQKMVRDTSLLNTQHYKVRIKGKEEQSRERSSAPPHTLV